MMKLWKRISARRDKRFLRRLERVLNDNILEANILLRGNIGGVYDYIYYDIKRGFRVCEQDWLDGWKWSPKKEFGQSVDRTKNI